jgi:hypothetical protein
MDTDLVHMKVAHWPAWLERSEEVPRPSLIVNPIGDRIFADEVRRLAVSVHGPEELQARLHRAYPAVVVRPRELSGERFVVWYVYRDGHWSPREL